MKTFRSRSLVTFACLMMLAAGCRGRKHASGPGSVKTETVAPAAAQPSPTGTDAMTQTVDVGDGRSEADGGAITDTAGGTTTTAAKAPTTIAKKKSKKK